MAAFACFSSSKEKTTDAYKDLIQRFRQAASKEVGQAKPVSTLSYDYFAAHKDNRTHAYKDYVYQLRKTEFNVPCVMLCENPTLQLKHYIQLIERVKLTDGHSSNAYYGEFKKIVTSFVNYFTHIIDDVVRRIDKYSHSLDSHKLMSLVDRTIEMTEKNQEIFLLEFSVKTPDEQEKMDEIVAKHKAYMAELRKLNHSLQCVIKPENIESFAKDHFETSIKKVNELCTFTHTYISVMLADRLYEIAVSLEETVDRLNTNRRKYNEHCAQSVAALIHDLYDKNKENLSIYRRDRKRSVDGAEIKRSIEVLKGKIEHYGNGESLARLELETRYWKLRLKDFNEIARILTKLQLELDRLEVEQKEYQTLRKTELAGPKTICFDMMGDNFESRKAYIKSKILEVSKTLVTFFCVRGTDRILYTDNVGSYYCDEFNHQNYITDYGLKFYHVNCVGNFLENYETDPYYFDDNGRYILVDDKKVHQCAPCTSQYELGGDGLFKKITVDCGHSTKVNDKCRMEVKDLTDVEILPTTVPTDITNSLDADTVKYLWDSFGMILPEVLYELALAKPKNPIHYLAHILLKRRFDATNAELNFMKNLADKYRADIYNERKEKAAAESRAWRAKFVRHRKPEDLDDSQEWAAYNQRVADWQFVNSLGYYE